MAEETLSARLVEIESMLERSRRRFEEGSRLVEEAQHIMGEIQQALIGSPRRVSPEDSEEAASRLLQSLKASGGEMPESLCGGRLQVDGYREHSRARRDTAQARLTLASDGGSIPVAPGLVTAGTDSRYMTSVADDVYRFAPMHASIDEFGMIHGTNEKMSLENLRRMTDFYTRLIATAVG